MNKYIFLIVFIGLIFVGCAPKDKGYVKVVPEQTQQVQNKEDKSISLKQTNKEVVSKQTQEKAPIVDKTTQDIEIKDYIAVVYPSAEINRYALEAINTMNGYLLQSHPNTLYHLESFDIKKQTAQTITTSLEKIANKEIKKVVLMITKDYLNILKQVDLPDDMTIVLPLINKDEIKYDTALDKLDLLFSGISYKKQFSKLISYAKGTKVVEFYDNSIIGTTLHNFLSAHEVSYSRKIDDNNGWYKKIVSQLKWRLQGSILILNTPIVKSSMLLSALTAEEITPKLILSTQLNFTPLIFSLTQKEDIDNVVIANSIATLPKKLKGYSELLGNNISYNWVNYSSMVAIEYLLSNNIDRFDQLKIDQKQVVYPVSLYQVKRSSFDLLRF